jgi:hypothetical protein
MIAAGASSDVVVALLAVLPPANFTGRAAMESTDAAR